MLRKPVFGIEAIPNTDLNWRYAVCCISQWLQILKIFCVVFPKYQKMTSTDLDNQCFKACSWTPLTMVKSLLLNSALLEIRTPALACYCSYASSVMNKNRNPLTVCGIRLYLRFPFIFCGIHFLLETILFYVRGIHGSFLSGVHLHFGTCFKISFWNPGTYRHKTVRLSSAQFGLVMSNVMNDNLFKRVAKKFQIGVCLSKY